MTDAMFAAPMLRDARFFASLGHTVYLYRFTHAGVDY